MYGFDLSECAVSEAKKKLPSIEFKISDIYKAPYSDNMFGMVLCSEVLEHLKRPEKALVELNRLAKKILIITVPNEPWFCLGNFLSGKNITRLGNPVGHINHWNCYNFKLFLQKFSMGRGETIHIYNCFTWIIAVIEKNEKTD